MTKYYIYRITAGDKYYIGSTKDFLKRVKDHRNCAVNETDKKYNLPLYVHMRKSKVAYDIIKEIEVLTKTEAEIEEQSEIDKIPEELRLNARKAHLTRAALLENARLSSKERYLTKGIECLKWQNEYYAKNKDTIKEKRRKVRAAKKAKNTAPQPNALVTGPTAVQTVLAVDVPVIC